MATRNFVPRQDKDGCLGTDITGWAELNAYTVNAKTNISTAQLSAQSIQTKSINAEETISAAHMYASGSLETTLLKLYDDNGVYSTINAVQLKNVLSAINNGSINNGEHGSGESSYDLSNYVTKSDLEIPHTSIIPLYNNYFDFGSSEKYWNRLYANTIYNVNLNSQHASTINLSAQKIILTDAATGKTLEITANSNLDNGNIDTAVYATKTEVKSPGYSITPNTSSTFNLGEETKTWKNGYINNVFSSTIKSGVIEATSITLTDEEGNRLDITASDTLSSGGSGGNIDTSNYVTRQEYKSPNVSIVPTINNSVNLGSSSKMWNNIFVSTVTSVDINSTNVIADTIHSGDIIISNGIDTLSINPSTKILTLTQINDFISNNYINKSTKESIIPSTSNLNLGSRNYPWGHIYVDNITTNSISRNDGKIMLQLVADSNGDYSFV